MVGIASHGWPCPQSKPGCGHKSRSCPTRVGQAKFLILFRPPLALRRPCARPCAGHILALGVQWPDLNGFGDHFSWPGPTRVGHGRKSWQCLHRVGHGQNSRPPMAAMVGHRRHYQPWLAVHGTNWHGNHAGNHVPACCVPIGMPACCVHVVFDECFTQNINFRMLHMGPRPRPL